MTYKEQSREYYKNNKDKMRLYSRKYRRKYKAWKKAIHKRGISTNLTEEQYNEIRSHPCIYCGETEDICIGIDRVDNSIGYMLDNCVACCSMCNMMKKDYPLDMWLEQIEKIYKHHA